MRVSPPILAQERAAALRALTPVEPVALGGHGEVPGPGRFPGHLSLTPPDRVLAATATHPVTDFLVPVVVALFAKASAVPAVVRLAFAEVEPGPTVGNRDLRWFGYSRPPRDAYEPEGALALFGLTEPDDPRPNRSNAPWA